MHFQLLWSDNRDKVERIEVSQPLKQGGLGIVNMLSYVTSLKTTWIRRLVSSADQTQKHIFASTHTYFCNLGEFGVTILEKIIIDK